MASVQKNRDDKSHRIIDSGDCDDRDDHMETRLYTSGLQGAKGAAAAVSATFRVQQFTALKSPF